ncbi:MAG: galactokinase family protein [Erysipelotrichaceae bacterium]|nr:galactokinase family protein [Erysipelotrichaceae bacterium]
MYYQELKAYINSEAIDEMLKKIVCKDDLTAEKARYQKLLDDALAKYGDGDYHFISSPGRTEIGGNHTDHQHGHVVAASLSIDNLVICKANNSNIVNYLDPAFKESVVDISDLSVNESEKNTSNSLIRGIAARLNELGYSISGFDALCDSRVLNGSGISSSACFEVMVAEIFNTLFNDCKLNPVDRAIISQYAENKYFGKPCGLLDQMAISVGGFVTMDFKDPAKPVINNFEFSFNDYGYELLLVNTKGDHADLSDEYAAIPYESKAVAKELGGEVLADASKEDMLKKLASIRKNVNNDRALLRSLHFYNEDRRAVEEEYAIKNKDINRLLKLITESGHSSYMYLQNVYAVNRPYSQSLALALALSDDYLQGEGAYRVHGGGFEGTIQAIVPKDRVAGYKELISSVYGDDAVLDIAVRPFGTRKVI